ncbi:MAG: hypothetical protein GY805_24990 [Chloroflexi bacterium]|nr:hypothetical protein [Chloroflexota bacterium]
MEYTLTVLDTASIQPYIFGSNELRENIGASHQVHQATTHWVQNILDVVVDGRHNYGVKQNEASPYKSEFRIEEQGKKPCAELLYAGGGNTFILFGGGDSLQTARKFVYQLSEKIIAEAPGLNLYAEHVSGQWGDNLPQQVDDTIKKLTKLKSQKPVYTPTLGLSVTAACVSTGLPANGTHPDPDKNGKRNGPTLANRANRQVWAQWAAAEEATERLRDMFKFVKAYGFEWTDNLDNIGKLPERDESFVAVVHADGNGMGKRMLGLSGFFAKDYPTEPRAYITAVRELSMSFHRTAQEAFACTIRDLAHSLDYHENQEGGEGKRYFSVIQDEKNKKKWHHYFPFRPVVFGGDDVTWVCAGPWGVPLAHRYLSYLEEMTLPDGKKLLEKWSVADAKKAPIAAQLTKKIRLPSPPYACAGVSIVKTHYPVSRAYDSSEALLQSAKAQVRLYDNEKKGSAIDWHITTTGLAGALDEIREQEYETTEPDKVTGKVMNATPMHKLTMRPLMLQNTHTWRNWRNFRDIFAQFQGRWFTSRNKVMALREALRGSTNSVEEFRKTERKGAALPTLPPFNFKVTDSNGEIILDEEIRLNNGWVDWPPEKIGLLRNLPDEEGKKQALDQIRCAYFDAIEMEEQFLPLEKHPDGCEEGS